MKCKDCDDLFCLERKEDGECFYVKELDFRVVHVSMNPDARSHMTRAEQIDFEQAVYDAFGQVKDFTLAMRIAKYFYEQAEKDILAWMEENLTDILDGAGERCEVISAFKKYMEETK